MHDVLNRLTGFSFFILIPVVRLRNPPMSLGKYFLPFSRSILSHLVPADKATPTGIFGKQDIGHIEGEYLDVLLITDHRLLHISHLHPIIHQGLSRCGYRTIHKDSYQRTLTTHTKAIADGAKNIPELQSIRSSSSERSFFTWPIDFTFYDCLSQIVLPKFSSVWFSPTFG